MRLKRLHSDVTLNSGRARLSLRYWRERSSEAIIASLVPRPGNKEALQVKKDGTIVQGNTRIKVLQDRGYNVESLPYELYP